MRKSKGITLIALVITIIILIILAGVSINLTFGDNGILTKAKEAKKLQEIASVIENVKLDLVSKQLEEEITLTEAQVEGVLNKYGTVNKNANGSIKSLTPEGKDYEIPFEEIWKDKIVESFDSIKKVNKPVLVSGMTPIKFTEPTDTAMGEVVKTNSNDENWYNYESKKWANTQTKDGSMWVWIPRFAYKITGQTIDIKFLIGKTDNYYIDEQTIGTAQRQTKVEQTIDSTADYTVHPAFTDETKINFANGGWDRELEGIWIAKFEAGYASGNNSAEVKASSVNYNNYNNVVWAQSTETGNAEGELSERNWLDGIYSGTPTSIKYPTFQGTTYSMNYINHNDAYNIAKALTEVGNIYGLNSNTADSHLMKNSEWGACAYLSQSKYGLNGIEMSTNNINLNSGGSATTKAEGNELASVYVVTGCSSNNTDKANVKTTITALNGVTGNTGVAAKASDNSDVTVYVWNQKTGIKASSTGTIYGIYDLSGGTWERTASYIANGDTNLERYGESISYKNNTLKTTSTKYTTVYPYSSPESETTDTASQNNFESNTKIYGDAVRETTLSNAGTSESGWNTSSWNSDYSRFPALIAPFFVRSGSWYGSNAGVFAFNRNLGIGYYNFGFRAALVPSV